MFMAEGMTFEEAKTRCSSMGGHLPMMSSFTEYLNTPNYCWTGLTTDSGTIDHCNGVVNCITTGAGYYWDGGTQKGKVPLTDSIVGFVNQMIVDSDDKCFRKGYGGQLLNEPCDDLHLGYCVFHSDEPLDVSLANVVTPQHLPGSFVCPNPGNAPSSSNFVLSTDLPDPLCIGTKVTYDCDAGGINVRDVSFERISIATQTLLLHL